MLLDQGSLGTTTVALRLLGEPSLRAADGGVSTLERKDAALLAYLALEGPTARAALAALLWPDADQAGARNNLRQRLHRLRRRAGAEVVAVDGDTMRLGSGVTHDLAWAVTIDAPADELLGTLDYADCGALHAWVDAARERRRNARRQALAAAAQQCERAGQLAAALRHAERLVTEDPLAESAHRNLMRLHMLRGDRAAALATYERCRATFAAQLRTLPSAETAALARQIEAGALAAAAVQPTPVGVLRPPRLVGRDAEWLALQRARSMGTIALVTGEPGAGKTRLLTDFVRARGGVLVGARPGDAQVPYALAARLLRALVAQMDAPVEPWARRELARLVPAFDPGWTPVGDVDAVRLAQAVQQLLAATHPAGSVIALDDLQYADAESLHMLPLAARGGANDPRWLLGAREHELPAVARQWLDALDASALARISLAPLDAAGVQTLLESLALPELPAARWARTIFRHTGGNPLFVLETLRALLAPGAVARTAARDLPLPTNVGQLIGARLAQLSGQALALAQVAALAGEDFDAETAAAVLCVHPLDLAVPWTELQRAHVLHDHGFAHDLVLDATQRSVAPETARLIHRAIAERLAQRAPARAAAHFESAQDWDAACATYIEAARGAGAASHRAEELRLLRCAASCVDRGATAADRFEIELRSARAAQWVDRTDVARACAEAALGCAATPAQRAEALAACAEAVDFLGQGERAIEYAQAGLRLALELRDAPLVLTLAGILGRLYGARGECERGLAVFEEYEPWLATEAGPAGSMFLAHRSQVLEQAKRRQDAAAVARRALALAVAAGDLTAACVAHTHLAAYCVRLGLKEETREHVTAALSLREELGATGGQTEMARVYQGVWSYQTGRYRQAMQHFVTAHERLMLGHATPWAIVARVALARVYITLGQPARAVQLLEAIPDGLPLAVRGLTLVALARALRLLGRAHVPLLEEALAIYPQHRQFDNDLMAQMQQALDIAPAAGAALAARVEAEARQRINRPLMLDAQAIACHCLLRAGAVTEASAMARKAQATAAQSIPWTVYPGEIQLWAFEALDAAGDRDAAVAALRAGVDWITHEALPNVPDEFRDSFLNRNAANRGLLTTASRRLR